MMKIKKALFMGVVWLSALVYSPIFVHAEEVEDVQTVSGCEVEKEMSGTVSGCEIEEAAAQIQLIDPQDENLAFYRGNGLVFSQEDSSSYIETVVSEVISSWVYFYTEDYDEFYNIQYTLDTSGISVNTPGHYTAVASITLTEPDKYILPEGFETISIPVHIRNSSTLEIYLESPGPMFSGSVYMPPNTEAAEGYLPAWYCYCGTDKPSVSTLDSQTFSQETDTSTPFFYADYYGGESGTIGIDFYEIPDEDGWYAFYTEAGGLYSNYILIDSRELTGNITYYDGTRSGDTNSDFPTVEDDSEDSSEDDSKNDSDDEDSDEDDAEDDEDEMSGHENTAGNSVQADALATKTVEASSPAADVNPPADTTTKSFDNELKEQDNADGTTVSGKRIRALVDSGSSFIVSKNNVTACFSKEALQALDIEDNDFLSVALTWSRKDTFCLVAALNGKELTALPGVLISFQDILYDSGHDQTIRDSAGNELPCQDYNGRLAFMASSAGEYTVSDEPVTESQSDIALEDTPEQTGSEAAAPEQATNSETPAEQSVSSTDSRKTSVYIVITTIAAAAVLSGAGVFLWYRRKRK